MDHNLVYTSDPVDVLIENYMEYKFMYHDWMISDNYVINENTPHHSHYSIIVTSPCLDDEHKFNKYVTSGGAIADKITYLVPLCGLPSLISQGTHDFFTNRSIIVPSESPTGWKSNYNEVRKEIVMPNGTGLFLESTAEFKDYAFLDETPLKELEIMLNKYKSISDEVRYLLFLNKCILSYSDSTVFMLLGKALEIIDAMYPLKSKKDRRIVENFPELTDIFNGYTIKDLFNLANNRKETRHFIKDKAKVSAHESLNEEERIKMYKCTFSLMINVLRDKFGLPRPCFEFY